MIHQIKYHISQHIRTQRICEIYESSKNIFFTKHFGTITSEIYCPFLCHKLKLKTTDQVIKMSHF